MHKKIFFLIFVLLNLLAVSAFSQDKTLKSQPDPENKNLSQNSPLKAKNSQKLAEAKKQSDFDPFKDKAPVKVELGRSPDSVKKIKKTTLKRDRRFKVPKTKTTPKAKRKRLDLRSIQPPSSSRLYFSGSSDEAELERVLNQEIKQLFNLLRRNRSAELTLRLGSLYVEKARLISFKIQMDYDKNLSAFKAGKRKTKPYLNLKPSQVYNKKSLKLFEDFKTSYPKHKRMDEVLFFLGFNFYQLDNEARGIKYFTELEQRFPKSFYLYESQFQLGEHYFQLSQWTNSLKYYSKVAKNKRGKFYFFALYKMAWSFYKMDKAPKGLALLEKIIREGQEFKVLSDRDQVVTFSKEAKDDLVLFYTYSRKAPSQAKSFFLSLLKEQEAWRQLKRLAYAYRDTGQRKGVYILFTDLINNDPGGEEAFEYKNQILETMYNAGKVTDIMSQARDWVDNYGPGSAWFQLNKRNKALIDKSFNFQEVTIRNYALKNHETFRRAKGLRAKALALGFYKIYFDKFKSSKYLDQMRFFYAELLFDNQKYVLAVKSYEEVISQFPKSKYAKPAYGNQILALEKVLPKDSEIDSLVGKVSSPVDFPGPVKSFVKIANRYVSKYPQEKNSPSILYRMAALYYKFNQFTTAAEYFKKLSDKYPSSKLSSSVGGILLDIYNKNKDYKSLEEQALRLSKNPNTNKELKKEAHSILEQISFKKAQDLSLKKDYKSSAKLYEKFARDNPTSSLASSAFYNAGLNFEKSKDPLQAIKMYSQVLKYKTEKNKSIYKNSQEFVAILYEKLGLYKKAANAYVAFSKAYPRDKKADDFWFNAGVIFEALGDKASAIYSYQKYLALSKKTDRQEVFYLIGLMYQRSRNWQKAVDYYSQYLKSPSQNKLRIIKASFAVADIYENKLKQKDLAKTWHQKTLGLYKRLRVGAPYGARSHFYISRAFYDRFKKIKIPANQKTQAQVVAKKIKALKELEKALKPVIRYNDGEQIIASLSLIGEANQEMAKAIYSAPIPKGLDKKGQQQYKEGIKKVIEPYIKEAVKHYQLALDKSSKLKIYSEWIQKSYRGLGSIKMVDGGFESFLPRKPFQELFTLNLLDPAGTVKGPFYGTKPLKKGLSRADFEKLSQAMASKREDLVLKASSEILNKDADNPLALNTLAYFYLQNNRLSMGTLILNRLAGEGKKSRSPEMLNNLSFVFLKYGEVREAVSYLKKAISARSSYKLASVNLANIFIQQYDYRNSYSYYKNSYNELIKKWPPRSEKAIALLNNYAVSLTGVKKWKSASVVFNNLKSYPSPLPEILFNYALFLTEKSKREDKTMAKKSLLQAKDLAEELITSPGGNSVKRKAGVLSNSISFNLKGLKALKRKPAQKEGG